MKLFLHPKYKSILLHILEFPSLKTKIYALYRHFPVNIQDFAQDYSLMMSMKAGTVHSLLTHHSFIIAEKSKEQYCELTSDAFTLSWRINNKSIKCRGEKD
jgi:hypothetical protein